MLLTIFTPTYNRASLLPALYHSIVLQQCEDIEWLIVDDGSTDNTTQVVAEFSKEALFDIRYIHQPNGGKHVAFNRGIMEARGEWFICADSDDPLTPDAICNIKKAIQEMPVQASALCGIFLKPSGDPLGSLLETNLVSNTVDIRDRYHLLEDRPEIYRTATLKQYAFPVFEGEKFLTEAELFDRMSIKAPFYYTNYPIQQKKYLDGGLTSKMLKIRIDSPNGTLLYYKERFYNSTMPIFKIRALLNYCRFFIHAKISQKTLKEPLLKRSLPLFPIAYIIYLYDRKKLH